MLTFEVLKFFIFNDFKDEHPLNIESIVMTLLVFKLSKYKYSRLEQPEKRFFILITFFVSKLIRGKLFNEEQSLNMPSILVNL